MFSHFARRTFSGTSAQTRLTSHRIIFAENHWDPSTSRILHKIAPHLSKMNYRLFLDEKPDRKPIEWHIDQHKDHEVTYAKTVSEFQQAKLDMSNERDVKLFVLNKLDSYRHLTDDSSFQQMTDHFFEALFDIINRHSSICAFKAFLESLKQLRIPYECIDLLIENHHRQSDKTYLAHSATREKHISKTFLTRTDFFSRIGLAHVSGIQNEIIKQIPRDVAADHFSYYYLYAKPSIPDDDFLEERIRSGRLKLPLGITTIDMSKKTDDQVIKQILLQISEKQSKLEEKPGSAPRP